MAQPRCGSNHGTTQPRFIWTGGDSLIHTGSTSHTPSNAPQGCQHPAAAPSPAGLLPLLFSTSPRPRLAETCSASGLTHAGSACQMSSRNTGRCAGILCRGVRLQRPLIPPHSWPWHQHKCPGLTGRKNSKKWGFLTPALLPRPWNVTAPATLTS